MTDRSAMPPEKQTDKSKTKEVPCTRCRRRLIVNTFYAPAKAVCSDCKESGGSISPAIRAAVEGARAEESAVEAAPNHALADLRCPFDQNPMILIRVNPEVGHLTFECQVCQCAVEVMPSWSPLLIASVPESLKPVVVAFNDDQLEWATALAEAGEVVRPGWNLRDFGKSARRRIGA